MKPYVKPKADRRAPEPPTIDGTPAVPGVRVTCERGQGTLMWCEWRTVTGEWVLPLERDASNGQWYGVVSYPHHGGYMAPLTELTRVAD